MVRKVLELMSASAVAKRRRARLMEVSRRVRGESLLVNAEFSEIEEVPGN
jgi:hypothetical protein